MDVIDRMSVLIMFGLTWTALSRPGSWQSWAGTAAGAVGLGGIIAERIV